MEEKLQYLRDNGVEVDNAIVNMVDVDTYNELLDDFFDSIDEELQNIDNYKNAGDMPNYAILVHAMKSNSRSFGFMETGEICYNHEMASKANDINFVNEHYNELLESINKMKNIISSYKSM
ncbi:MAG: Hpt domain-containing protein [Bacilli bacterium]|nr:Hpt domain-containing protein [Bacilli bacterium]